MKVLSFNFNGVLDDVEAELKRQGHEVLPHYKENGQLNHWKHADVVVVWQESPLGGWRDWVRKAQKHGKRVVLVQHGRRGVSRIFPPFNEKLISDQLCVWGENDVKRMLSCGVPREKIFVTGTPIVNHIKPRLPHKGINVVFSPEHWDVDVFENIIVAGALRKMKGVKIITKILEREHNPKEYDNPVSSNRLQPGHIDKCIEVLQTADAVVAISEGTFELLAEIMNIPVIIADIWVQKPCNGDEKYREYYKEYSSACAREKDISKLGDTVWKHLKNPQLLEKERRELAILDGGVDIENPTQEIINVILGND